MNVYKKIQTCRVELKKLPIKESGNNKFAGYTYMELSDFLPHIVDLCQEHGLCPVVCFGDIATLTIINSDKPEEQVVFTSPMSTAELKGCHAIQNLGAVETYLRRYLYVAAFDIVEHDALDSTHGKDQSPGQKQNKPTPPSTPPAAPVNEKDAEYHARIKTALHTIYGADRTAALNKVEELTSFVPKGKTEAERVKGVRDFTKLTGQRVQILCHNLEKLLPAKEPMMCVHCHTEMGADGICHNTLCEMGEP